MTRPNGPASPVFESRAMTGTAYIASVIQNKSVAGRRLIERTRNSRRTARFGEMLSDIA